MCVFNSVVTILGIFSDCEVTVNIILLCSEQTVLLLQNKLSTTSTLEHGRYTRLSCCKLEVCESYSKCVLPYCNAIVLYTIHLCKPHCLHESECVLTH